MMLTKKNADEAHKLLGKLALETTTRGLGKDWRFISAFLGMASRHLAEPSMQANVTFVPHGYQIDVLIDGEEYYSVCRDFGGNYDNVEELSVFLANRLGDVMKGFEREFKKSRRKAG